MSLRWDGVNVVAVAIASRIRVRIRLMGANPLWPMPRALNLKSICGPCKAALHQPDVHTGRYRVGFIGWDGKAV